MGCNNSHLRPLIRRCRKRSKKDDQNNQNNHNQGGKNPEFIEANHYDSVNHHQELLKHQSGFQFLGSSIKNPAGTKNNLETSNPNNPADSPFCVPLLAQSEASSSQLDFFKMLDQKIDEGPDFDSDQEDIEWQGHRARNLEIWKKGIQSFSWTRRRSENLTRCQWDEDNEKMDKSS